ncbi:hypothetical protein [Radiobacillus deserti]|uniref:Phenylalanyl-tRNA synthetase subunit beta n=1 Tax=Radiobacillus deserti TaxID=2594883 RepID=A0A516KIJ9_9BACI|nr:hypothetical protein [Radiobacillus deserti]QDP41222.1 hypothetical protein FN924_14140 [Radiobacillus deserti]
MRKLLKILLVLVIVLIALGFGAYNLATKYASDKVMEYVSTELESSGEIKTIKQEIEQDRDLQSFLEGAEDVDPNTLPFTTKEEATKAIIKKMGLGEIQEIQSKVSDGITAEEKQEILSKVEDTLTEEELLALKVIAYKELNGN